MSFVSNFGSAIGDLTTDNSGGVGPVESNTPGWPGAPRLNLWQVTKMGFSETFRKQSFGGGSEMPSRNAGRHALRRGSPR